MFLLEIIAPWLLLVPLLPVRRVGVLIQVPFQMAIMLTGNYNWYGPTVGALNAESSKRTFQKFTKRKLATE